MRVEIVAPPKVAAGAPVPIGIRIANTGGRAIELHLQGRTTVFDLVVSRHPVVPRVPPQPANLAPLASGP